MDNRLEVEDLNEYEEDKIKLVADNRKRRMVLLVLHFITGKKLKNKPIYQIIKCAAYNNKQKLSSYKKRYKLTQKVSTK